MKKSEVRNSIIKRKYLTWLKDSGKYVQSTINSVEKSIWKYEEFTKGADFATASQSQFKQFKSWLGKQKKKRGKGIITLTTQYHYLRHLKSFFTWLSGQPGYKSRVSSFDASLLKLEKEQAQIATSTKRVKYPGIDYVKALCASITIKDEIDKRDRALIAFHLLSAMRVAAIFSLPIGCFEVESLVVFQEPKEGVKTKGTKSIVTTLLRFDDELLQYVLDWVEFLTKEKLYDKTQPLFPRTKLEHVSSKNACFIGKGLEPVFWKSEGPILKIFKRRTKEAVLPYYSPHKFRHAAIAESRKYCRTEEQRKAISQNVGHKHVGTTFAYGNMDNSKVNEVVSRMRLQFTDNKGEVLKNYSDDELLDELKSRR